MHVDTGETVLITGVTGRVGANLAVALHERGYGIRALVLPDDPAAAKLERLPAIDVVEGGLDDQVAVDRAVEGADSVVHLAAQMVIGATPADAFFDTNTMGTLRLLEASVAAGRRVRRFVLASTDGTYGPVCPRYLPIDEQHPQLPGDHYGTSKLLAEHLVRNYGEHYGLEWSIVRFGSVLEGSEPLSWFRRDLAAGLLRRAELGPRSHVWGLFRNGQSRAWEELERAVPHSEPSPAVALHGPDGEPWAIHLTDVRDVVQGTVLALEHPDAGGEDFNIVGPETVPHDRGASIIADALDLPRYDVQLPMKWAFSVSADKARERLGFRPEWTFERMVRSALPEASSQARA